MKLGVAFKVAAVLCAFIMLGVSVVGFVMTRDSSQMLRDLSFERLDTAAELARRQLSWIFDSASHDLQLLSQSRELRGYATGETWDAGHLAELFESVLLSQPWYSQVRLISAAEQGREVVRLNRVGARAQRVAEAQLQRKGERHYVREALALPAGQVYFSRISLNREHGKIEQPPRPTLHCAMPLFGPIGDRATAIVVINVDMTRIFEDLKRELGSNAELLIANSAGDYLVHPLAEYEFGFERNRVYRVQKDFPGLEQMDPATTDSVRQVRPLAGVPGEHVVAFRWLAFPGESPQPWLTLGAAEPLVHVESELGELLQRSFWVTGVLGLLAASFALMMVHQVIGPLRRMARSVSRYRGGERLHGLPTERGDEVGVLARSFEQMASRMAHQIEWLDNERSSLEALIETAADAILLIDNHGNIERCNSAVTRLFGYSREELVGNNVSLLMNTTDRERHDGYLAQYQRTGKGSIIGVGREVSGLHKDGSELHLYLSIGEFEVNGRKRFTGILHDMSERLRLEEELRTQATTDSLTGIHNRRYFLERLAHEVTRKQRYGSELSLMLVDLDRFKRINDEFGHESGDQALLTAVGVIRRDLRDSDLLARFGGDEFAIMLPETDRETAAGVARRICEAGARTPALDQPGAPMLGLSIGVASVNGNDTEVLKRVDKAMYAAKQAGRGQVKTCEE